MIVRVGSFDINIDVFAGVFPPTVAARRFLGVLRFVDAEKHSKVLDLGCGTGVFSLALALHGYTDILAVDRVSEALDCTLHNARLNGVSNHISVRESDGLSAVKSRERFSLIVSNPSNLPRGIWADENDKNLLVDREAMEGPRGNEVLMQVIDNIDAVMDKGRFVFLQPTYTNTSLMKKKLQAKGFTINVLYRTTHVLDTWPWDEWKYSKEKLIEKLKKFEREEGEKDYIVYENGVPAMILEIVEAVR